MTKNTKILIMATTVGIILSLLISIMLILPLIRNYSASKNQALYKNTFTLTQKVMKELAQDRANFEDISEAQSSHNGDKFCKAFAKKVGAVGPVNCKQKFAFKTKNGVYWSVPGNLYNGALEHIMVDVSGDPKSVSAANLNCTYNPKSCPNPDQFVIFITSNGEATVQGMIENVYLGKNPCMPGQRFKNGQCVLAPVKCKKITEYYANGSCHKSECPEGLIFHMGACYKKGQEPPYKLSERIQLLFE